MFARTNSLFRVTSSLGPLSRPLATPTPALLSKTAAMSTTPAKVGGTKVYFPKTLVTLVRTPQLPSTQAAFDIPPSMNKLDVVSYLRAVYDLPVTDVRTVNFDGKVKREQGTRHRYRLPARKRAIVTMDRPFHWPPEPEPSEFETSGTKDIYHQTEALARSMVRRRASLQFRGWLMPGRTSHRTKPSQRVSWVAEEAQLRGFEGPTHPS